MRTICSVDELTQLSHWLETRCEALSITPGCLFRIPCQYMENFGIVIDPQNRDWLEQQSVRSYTEEWTGGDGQANEAIERAIAKANIAAGNRALNTLVARRAADILLALGQKSSGVLHVLDIGAGTGDTSLALLQALSQTEESALVAARLRLHLLEPSPERLQEALGQIEKHFPKLCAQCSGITLPLERFLADSPLETSLDLVISSAVLHHMSFPTYLTQLRSLLSPQGALVVGDWHNSVFSHPASLISLIEQLGASAECVSELMAYFDVRPGQAQALEAQLQPALQVANHAFRQFVLQLGLEMGRLEKRSRLGFLEALEPIGDSLQKLHQAGYCTDLTVLKARHPGFCRLEQTVTRLLPESDVAHVIAAAPVGLDQ